ncbi:MAG: hypothetical protein HC933_03665 [Pleurocapsa sp. SU_196_0]|nr:hypothetical protein [Pleurocapsa sp. SU_196_0]
MFWFATPVISIVILLGLFSTDAVSLTERARIAHGIDALRRLKTLQVVSRRVTTRADGQVVDLGVEVMDYDFVVGRVRLKQLRQSRIEQIVRWDGSQLLSWQLGDVERGFPTLLTRTASLTGPFFLRDLETEHDCTNWLLITCTLELPRQNTRIQFQLTESGLIKEQFIQVDGEALGIQFESYRKIAGIQLAHRSLYTFGGINHESHVIRIAIDLPWAD